VDLLNFILLSSLHMGHGSYTMGHRLLFQWAIGSRVNDPLPALAQMWYTCSTKQFWSRFQRKITNLSCSQV